MNSIASHRSAMHVASAQDLAQKRADEIADKKRIEQAVQVFNEVHDGISEEFRAWLPRAEAAFAKGEKWVRIVLATNPNGLIWGDRIYATAAIGAGCFRKIGYQATAYECYRDDEADGIPGGFCGFELSILIGLPHKPS